MAIIVHDDGDGRTNVCMGANPIAFSRDMPPTSTSIRCALSEVEKSAIIDLRTVVPSLDTVSDSYIARFVLRIFHYCSLKKSSSST